MDSRYPIIIALVALLLCGAVGLVNYSLDPYLLFNFEAADSARLSRIDQFNHMRITKPWYLQKVKPTAVIVGSSRSARLLPIHESWADEKGYNLAVPGMTIAEIADATGFSATTIKNKWAATRLWLRYELIEMRKESNGVDDKLKSE